MTTKEPFRKLLRVFPLPSKLTKSQSWGGHRKEPMHYCPSKEESVRNVENESGEKTAIGVHALPLDSRECVFLCVHMCAGEYICISLCVKGFMCVFLCVQCVWVSTYACLYACVFICMCSYVYICVGVSTYIHIYMYISLCISHADLAGLTSQWVPRNLPTH